MVGAVVGWLLLLAAAAGGYDCTKDWRPPQNKDKYPNWIYCNRRPGDGQTKYKFMADILPPADVAPHKCSSGVLKADSSGILCADYSQGDEYTGPCNDSQCCVPALCDSHTCSKGWTLKASPSDINCHLGCTDEICCDPPSQVPRHHAQGIMFVDKDPAFQQYGGTVTIIRAIDESDITHYVLYWG
eukprot:Sspe_Gene.112606::Locus_95675_Transcript_2_2_Confidence_0.667_Length_615::g.112606::m.112606